MKNKKRLLICDGLIPEFIGQRDGLEIWTQAEFGRHVRRRGLWHLICAYTEATMVMHRLWLRPRLLLAMSVLWLMSPRACYLADEAGCRVRIGPMGLFIRMLRILAESLQLPFLLRSVKSEVITLKRRAAQIPEKRSLVPGWVLYLKTDLWFSTQTGGSVTHMAGVANHLDVAGWSPWVFATASNPILSVKVKVSRIFPDESFWDFREVPPLRFSRKAFGDVKDALGRERPTFIYQRYSLNNYAAVRLAQDLSVPLVTEYNGSEVWIGKNWGSPVVYPGISEEIERLNLDAADLIVVVSSESKSELINRGVDSSRILINPNGVDAELFHPKIEDRELRRTLGLTGHQVIGFIGTFGPWHGTEELVKAFARLLDRFPEAKENLHLLMVGDGVMRNSAEKLASELNIHQCCTFTGQVPQAEGPRYLACCDILVAPHVPNPDGTPFFGSPTKLFEYMAMGRPIVASRLGQMEEVLDHDQTAWLVEPGDTEALVDGLACLLGDKARTTRLGEAARHEVLAKYTWQVHVNKILGALQGGGQ